MLVGYARVSSVGQSLDVQIEKLSHAGCERLYQEKVSGRTLRRTELHACLAYVREGDTLLVTKLDRLARSTLDLCSIVAELERKGVQFVVLDQALETQTPTGKLLFHVLSAISEFETALRKERQQEGIGLAKNRGVHFGRVPRLTSTQVAQLREARHTGILIKELMGQYHLSKASVYRYLESQSPQE